MSIRDYLKPAILYSFRRCPYAIRARMALSYSCVAVEVREVSLRDKPAELIKISSKATVPVLVLSDKKIIDESLDIMLWSLSLADPGGWLHEIDEQFNLSQIQLIKENDQDFKPLLDDYKYADRFTDHTQQTYRDRTIPFLNKLEHRLLNQRYLMDDCMRLVDVALFPFIRQYAFVDKDWFDDAHFPNVAIWLNRFLNHDLFKRVMYKQAVWKPGNEPVYLKTSSQADSGQ